MEFGKNLRKPGDAFFDFCFLHLLNCDVPNLYLHFGLSTFRGNQIKSKLQDMFVSNLGTLNESTLFHTRCAPTSYEWGYTPYKWSHNPTKKGGRGPLL